MMEMFYILIGAVVIQVHMSNPLTCTLRMETFYCVQLCLQKYPCSIFINVKKRQNSCMVIKVRRAVTTVAWGEIVVVVVLIGKGEGRGSLPRVLGMFYFLIFGGNYLDIYMYKR